jgi:hypothetical protein
MSQSVAMATIDFQGFSHSGGSSARHETRHGGHRNSVKPSVRWSLEGDKVNQFARVLRAVKGRPGRDGVRPIWIGAEKAGLAG